MPSTGMFSPRYTACINIDLVSSVYACKCRMRESQKLGIVQGCACSVIFSGLCKPKANSLLIWKAIFGRWRQGIILVISDRHYSTDASQLKRGVKRGSGTSISQCKAPWASMTVSCLLRTRLADHSSLPRILSAVHLGLQIDSQSSTSQLGSRIVDQLRRLEVPKDLNIVACCRLPPQRASYLS